MSNLRVFHEEILEEEGLKVTDLPAEIQKKIKGFNLLKGKWEKNPEDDKQLNMLKKQAVKIGDMVQDFIENDYDEEDEDDNDSKKSEPSNKSSKEDKSDNDDDDDDSTSKKSDKSDRKPKKTSGAGFGNAMMEKKILSIMEAKGQNRIKISDLESIIGREPDYPEQKVNNITLRKVFLSSDYRLV